MRDYFTKCVDLRSFLHQAVLAAAVGNSCHCSHVEGGGSSAEADGADGFHGLGWQLCLPVDLLGSCTSAQLPMAQSASPAAELFWAWAIWLPYPFISLWNPNEFGPLAGAGGQQEAIQLTVLPTAQDTHFKASRCLSASSGAIFRVLSEWQSKT